MIIRGQYPISSDTAWRSAALLLLAGLILAGCGSGGDSGSGGDTGSGDDGSLPLDGAISLPAGDARISVGNGIVFAAAATGGAGARTYQWDFGGGASPSGQEFPGAVQFKIPGRFTVTLTVTDETGDSITDSREITVMVTTVQTYLAFATRPRPRTMTDP